MKRGSRQYVIDDLSMQESWRLFKIMAEFVDGFDSLSDIGPAVSIFGSARSEPGSKHYVMAEEIAAKLAQANFSIITGGGPGLMEAANKGCHDAGGESIGLHIHLPFEQHYNQYLDMRIDFNYFFIRKVMFIKYAAAYVALPGGFGTMDELFEALVLIQTKRIKPFPIVMVDSGYWNGLVDWIKTRMLEDGFIHEEDQDLFMVTDSPEEAVRFIKRHVIV